MPSGSLLAERDSQVVFGQGSMLVASATRANNIVIYHTHLLNVLEGLHRKALPNNISFLILSQKSIIVKTKY